MKTEFKRKKHKREFQRLRPYHRNFLVRLPPGDEIRADDRSTWITEDKPNSARWVLKESVAPGEKPRLVSLTFSDMLVEKVPSGSSGAHACKC
jgi:hypothetical protein